MPEKPPLPEEVEDWIAGRLPAGAAGEIEAYFERYPEQLAEVELERGILKDAAQTGFHDADLAELMGTLKKQSFETSAENEWLELLQSTDRPGLIGTLGNYEILEVLATTGMATVLKASDPELDRLVALKILSHGLATDPQRAREVPARGPGDGDVGTREYPPNLWHLFRARPVVCDALHRRRHPSGLAGQK